MSAATIEAATGLELEKLVAEHVMGWSEVRLVVRSNALFGCHPKWGNCRTQILGYARRVAAAALVAEEMVRHQFEFVLTRTRQPSAAGSKCWHEATFTLWFQRENDPARAVYRHAEETVAICRAALLVIEHGPGSHGGQSSQGASGRNDAEP